MAARENQGLQIALIIFVMLTIILGVTSFWFFDQYKNEHIKSENDRIAKKKAEDALRTSIDEMTELKRVLGFASRDEVPAIVAAHKKDMETYGKTFPEAKQHYRNVDEYLATQLRNVNGRLIDRDARVAELESKIKEDEKASQVGLANYSQTIDKNKVEAEQLHKKFNEDRDVFKKSTDELARRFDAKRKEFDEIQSKSSKDLEDVTNRLIKMTGRVEDLVAKGKDEEIKSEQADGKVTWVNQRARVVWVNLGADDGLRRQISFKVIGTDENNPLKADKKGSIEVTRVLDRHLAEARIIDDSPSNPIMPGDQVFSPAWQSGRGEHFALAGFMDTDKDGTSDRQRIKDVITLNGGTIDAELTDDGKLVGELTTDTRYLVLGERPTGDKNTGGDFVQNWSTIMGQAKTLPVRQISVPELIDYLGYEARERTIPLGSDSKASDFRPRAPDGMGRKSNNNMFRPRRNSPTGTVKSAY